MSSFDRKLAKVASELRALTLELSAGGYRADRLRFAREVLGLSLDGWQEAVIAADGKRDILNCSRQAGKSTTAAVLALHEAMYRPGSVTVLVSPTLRQSSELFRKVADLRDLLPAPLELAEDNRLSMVVRGGGRVLSLPGSEATIRGISSVSLLVEDEASRVDEDLYLAVRPMLAVSAGRLVLMSTPNGKRGHFWEVWSEGQGWNRVRVPATDVPRISPEFLEDERHSMPERYFRQEYMCEFMDADDQVFGHEYVMAALHDDVAPLFGGQHA